MQRPAASLQLTVALAAALPAATLLARFVFTDLGANPVETVTHTTGTTALWLLLGSLAVTPARRWLGLARLAPLRRTLGLAAFTYAGLHLATWLLLDHGLSWDAIADDLVERPYVIAGMSAFLCLLPLAATSTRAAMRRLGRRWITLHRLVYAAAAAAVVHHWWLVKADLRAPLLEAGVLGMLLLARVLRRPGSRPGGPPRGW